MCSLHCHINYTVISTTLSYPLLSYPLLSYPLHYPLSLSPIKSPVLTVRYVLSHTTG